MEFFSHDQGLRLHEGIFFLKGLYLLKMQKIDSLSRPKSVSFKEQKL